MRTLGTLILAAALGACGGTDTPAPPAYILGGTVAITSGTAATVTVTYRATGPDPASVSVPAGGSIQWVHGDTVAQTIHSPSLTARPPCTSSARLNAPAALAPNGQAGDRVTVGPAPATPTSCSFHDDSIPPACGGGGGGGGDSKPPAGAFTLAASSADFTALQNQAPPASRSIALTVTGSNVTYVGAAYAGGQTQPGWLGIDIVGSGSSYNLVVSILSTSLPAGRYTSTFQVGTADSRGNVLQQRSFTVTYMVNAGLAMSVTPQRADLIFGDTPFFEQLFFMGGTLTRG